MGQGAALNTRVQRRSVLGAGVAGAVLAGCKEPVSPTALIAGGFVGESQGLGHVLRHSSLPQFQGGTEEKLHTVIAGAGVAGLSAARALRLQGIEDFVVLDLEASAGGNARGASMGGIRHPLGAHYLPVPGDDAPEVQDFLEELGLRSRVSGRWRYAEKALCHSPKERLFFQGAWQEGLLPTQGVSVQTQAQYAKFAQLVSAAQQLGLHRMPQRTFGQKTPDAGYFIKKFAISFRAFLAQNDLQDPHLLWYLDYCCRDDYGAGIDSVSAFAGLHYFAARHGFRAPGQDGGEAEDSVLTWPQGNAFLTEQLAAPLQERLRLQQLVLRIEEQRGAVLLDVLDAQTRAVKRLRCERCIVALPVHVAARVVHRAPSWLLQTAQQMQHAAWWVANIELDAPLRDDGLGAHPAWDNVIYGSTGLGYVDAMHQSTRTAPGKTVLTYYHAAGTGAAARQAVYSASWQQLRDQALAEIAVAHPDIGRRAQRVHITRYGHAMAVPTPQVLSQISNLPAYLLYSLLQKTEQKGILKYPATPLLAHGRLRFAHSDYSGYSVFEEAFTRGLHAGLSAA
jgi:monoamine oxidase